MKTRRQYEKLLLHVLQPGEVVRVKVDNHKNFNSQRMIIRRILTSNITPFHIRENITISKHIVANCVYLKITFNKTNDEFEFIENDGTIVKKQLPADVLTSDEIAFKEWQKSIGEKTT